MYNITRSEVQEAIEDFEVMRAALRYDAEAGKMIKLEDLSYTDRSLYNSTNKIVNLLKEMLSDDSWQGAAPIFRQGEK